jgi:ClpP class serine protease
MKRLALQVGQYYAIKPSAIERDQDGFFLIVGDSTPENETRGTVVVVHVRGALSQFDGEGGDSYEAIVKRVATAMASDPKPSSIVLCISSPGGLVAGLNEAVFKLQRMSKDSGIPLIAYVNELAASAAFALCCACSRRLAPPSAIAGSIGTISTMVSMDAQDKANGLDFRIITSGKRKADGHPHQPIEEAAVKAEKARNAELAEQFYSLAAKALKVSPRKLEGLEAAIYVGANARKVGLVDEIVSLDMALLGLDKTETKAPPAAPNEGNVTDRRAKELDTSARLGTPLQKTAQSDAVAQAGSQREAPMKVRTQALIKTTEAALATETDPSKLRILEAKLGTLQARAEMDDDDDDDDKKKKSDDDDDGDEESKAAKAAKKAEEMKKAAKAAGHRAKAAEFKKKAEEAEEEAKRCEADDDEEASKKGEGSEASIAPGALAAITSTAGLMPDALRRIEKLEQDATERQRKAMVDGAKAERKITPAEYKALVGKPIAFVRDFLSMRPHAIVNVDDEALEIPDVHSVAGDVPATVKAMVESAVQSLGLKGEKAEQHREKQYAAFRAGTAGRAVTH